MAPKFGGLNDKRPWSVLGTCSGLATDLVGSRHGLGRPKTLSTLKMVRASQLVPMPSLRQLALIIFQLRVCMDATRISDGRPVMLKRLLNKEGPYELQINKLFSTEPLSSNPRNRCAQLLDVIQLANEDPIMVHSLLRPFDNPPLRTYGEFITFFAQICEVRHFLRFGSDRSSYKGVQFMHSNNVAHRYIPRHIL